MYKNLEFCQCTCGNQMCGIIKFDKLEYDETITTYIKSAVGIYFESKMITNCIDVDNAITTWVYNIKSKWLKNTIFDIFWFTRKVFSIITKPIFIIHNSVFYFKSGKFIDGGLTCTVNENDMFTVVRWIDNFENGMVIKIPKRFLSISNKWDLFVNGKTELPYMIEKDESGETEYFNIP